MAKKPAAASASKGGAKKSGGSGDSKKEKKGGGGGDKMGTCKEIKAKHILCEKMGKSDEIMIKLREGWLDMGNKVPAAEFSKLAQQYSDCSSGKKGGDLGWFGRGKMVGAFQDAAFLCPVGEITTCKSPHGYHIILVEGRRN